MERWDLLSLLSDLTSADVETRSRRLHALDLLSPRVWRYGRLRQLERSPFGSSPVLLGITVALQSLVADVLQTATMLVLSETAETCPTTDSFVEDWGSEIPGPCVSAVADILASVLRAAGALPACGSRHRIFFACFALQRFCPHLLLARWVRPFRLRLLAPPFMPHSVANRVLCTLNNVIRNGSRHCVAAS